ncbi:MAG: hypothetical protein Fur0041_10270 [Bacteroidia bacterium]
MPLAIVVYFLWPSKADYCIRLRWIKAYQGQTWSDAEQGLAVSLSYLGAGLPSEQKQALINHVTDSDFDLHLDHADFSDDALKAMLPILDSLRNTDEYNENKSIDLGRLLDAMLYNTRNYYLITGAEATVKEVKKKFISNDDLKFYLSKSEVASGDSVLHFRKSGFHMLHLRRIYARHGTAGISCDCCNAERSVAFCFLRKKRHADYSDTIASWEIW